MISSPPHKPSWIASLEFPINSMSYKLLEFSEDAGDLLDHVCHFAETIRVLKADGWVLELDLREHDATYTVTHPRYTTASDANGRLKELGIRRLKCFDVSDFLAE